MVIEALGAILTSRLNDSIHTSPSLAALLPALVATVVPLSRPTMDEASRTSGVAKFAGADGDRSRRDLGRSTALEVPAVGTTM